MENLQFFLYSHGQFLQAQSYLYVNSNGYHSPSSLYATTYMYVADACTGKTLMIIIKHKVCNDSPNCQQWC